MKWRLILTVFMLECCLGFPLSAQSLSPGAKANGVEIQSVTVDGKPVPLRKGGRVNLGPFPKNISFQFEPATNSGSVPARLRFRMEGYENDWHDGGGYMYLAVRFFNRQGDQIYQTNFPVHRESAGWTGSLNSSPLTHRRETVVAPPQAATVWIVLSSAGPPATVGIYVIADLTVSKSSGNATFVKLIQTTFEGQPDEEDANQPPPGWIRDGNVSSMAKIVTYGVNPATKAIAILDDDPTSHAEWRTVRETAPAVAAGDQLLIEWNEMYSMGVGDYRAANYDHLPPGDFRFDLQAVDIMGQPIEAGATLAVLVPQPFWRMLWFWCVMLLVITGVSMGGGRYWVWRKMRREMLVLKSEQALEQERLRIAHDIHDDLGARITQICLVSAMAQNNPTFPEKARADLERISQMSRELVSALYETVWAVNPENDHLEALGNYLCQLVNQLCERTSIRCRFHMAELPREIEVSSQTRHNISMAVKEAVHNAIKHARASEIAMHITMRDDLLTISVQDDGRGFDPVENCAGNGLRNIKLRLENIGGSCSVASKLGQGTAVELRLMIRQKPQVKTRAGRRAGARK
jgi:signal transduction histidine kinase